MADKGFEVKELLEERTAVQAEVNELVDVVKREAREFNDDEITRFDSLEEKLESLDKRIKTAERLAKVSGVSQAPVASLKRSSNVIGKNDYSQAFRAWLLSSSRNVDKIPDIYRDSANRLGVNLGSDIFRDQSVGTTGEGNELTSESQVASMIEKNLKDYGGINSVATIMPTSTGEPLHIPTYDDTASVAELLDELDEVDDTPITFAKKQLSIYDFATANFMISLQLIQDSHFPIVPLVAGELSERIFRGVNAYWTTGAGTTEPTGVTVGAGLGGTLDSQDAVSLDEMFDIKYSVDTAYHNRPSFCYMMHPLTWVAMRKLTESESSNKYLIQPDPTQDSVLRFDGTRVILNSDMPQLGSGNQRVIVCGDFSKFVIRTAGQPMVRVANELFLRRFGVGVFAMYRTDSVVVNSSALKYLKTPAS